MGNKTITPEVKQRIFALYWGVKCFVYGDTDTELIHEYQGDFDEWCYLVLNPLSSISDEDVKECLRLSCYSSAIRISFHENEDGIGWCIYEKPFPSSAMNVECLPQIVVDYLRSKGYALPYLDYCIDDLISAKVFQLTN